jgi:hypothetical protein
MIISLALLVCSFAICFLLKSNLAREDAVSFRYAAYCFVIASGRLDARDARLDADQVWWRNRSGMGQLLERGHCDAAAQWRGRPLGRRHQNRGSERLNRISKPTIATVAHSTASFPDPRASQPTLFDQSLAVIPERY